MEIETITIKGGKNKNNKIETLSEITMRMGDVVSIVGPTGCGKTTLINDLGLFAAENTPSNRIILINGEIAPEDYGSDPGQNPIALISQHTNFLSDLPVNEFLEVHSTIRGHADIKAIVKETLDFANQLTGEMIIDNSAMTELSGGQTRSLLIADAVIIGNSPIILLDEIENAGINRTKALELLKQYRKIFIFVTHDPRIALLSDYRIVMRQGGMEKLIRRDEKELAVAEEIKKIDDLLVHFRSCLRDGEKLGDEAIEMLKGRTA
ncbi:MAG TPA: ATP-binding cassette domain-containing protein [bacterium]|nr:ATP-binding cassette domain-containing protein [bacterium]HPS30648.1 ATP-binding cassette domain-containing protein [bacterium]